MAQNAVPVVADSLGLDVQRTFLNFLQTFAADGNEDSPPDYLRAVEEMKDQDRTTLYVDYNHLLECARAASARSAPAAAHAVSVRAGG